MNDMPPSLDKKEKNWFIGILKLVFILAAFTLVSITVLSNMGGSNDSLKDSVERFVSGMFQGRPTKVDTLVHMSFFPKLGFDAKGINVLSSPENGYAIVEIGRVHVFMGFWNVALRRPHVSQFYIEDFKAIKGAMGSKEFYAEKVFIDHDIEAGKAKLRGNGLIGDNPWSFDIDIKIMGLKGHYDYSFDEKAQFTVNIADIKMDGVFINHEDGYFKFQDFKIISDDIDIGGNIVLSALGNKMLKLKGEINSSGNILSPDLVFDYVRSPVKIEGTLSSNVDNKDIDISDVSALLLKLRDIIGYDVSTKDADSYDWGALFDFSNVNLQGQK